MQATVFNPNEDMLVFGVADGSFKEVLDKGIEFSGLIWQPEGQNDANDPGTGGIWADGYYVGWSGESIIGTRDKDGLEIIGGDCQIAGVLNVNSPRHHSSKSSKDYF